MEQVMKTLRTQFIEMFGAVNKKGDCYDDMHSWDWNIDNANMIDGFRLGDANGLAILCYEKDRWGEWQPKVAVQIYKLFDDDMTFRHTSTSLGDRFMGWLSSMHVSKEEYEEEFRILEERNQEYYGNILSFVSKFKLEHSLETKQTTKGRGKI
ncbi:hypothetical protein [Burkholderia cenocepacia]|uniref:hypothetical protein n=2 Tax=Burkholderiales TaxID=80840 RepID=UPI00117752F1|nr:hypothetical protein [Burkholderia cenocepacia]